MATGVSDVPYGVWQREDDDRLIQARAQGLNWDQIKEQYLPAKSSIACRYRHEHLMKNTNSFNIETATDTHSWQSRSIDLTQTYSPSLDSIQAMSMPGLSTSSGSSSSEAAWNSSYQPQSTDLAESDWFPSYLGQSSFVLRDSSNFSADLELLDVLDKNWLPFDLPQSTFVEREDFWSQPQSTTSDSVSIFKPLKQRRCEESCTLASVKSIEHENKASPESVSHTALESDGLFYPDAHDLSDYICPFCDSNKHVSSWPDDLKSHVRLVHPDKDEKDPILQTTLSRVLPMHTRRYQKGVAAAKSPESPVVEMKDRQPSTNSEAFLVSKSHGHNGRVHNQAKLGDMSNFVQGTGIVVQQTATHHSTHGSLKHQPQLVPHIVQDTCAMGHWDSAIRLNEAARSSSPTLTPLNEHSLPQSVRHLESPEQDQEGHVHKFWNDQSPANASIDSDVLSISNFSEETQTHPLGEDDKLVPIVNTVLDRLLANFHASMNSISTPVDGESNNNNASGSSNSGTADSFETRAEATGPRLSRARLFSQRDSDDCEEDDPQGPPNKKRKQVQKALQRKTFACPFWKYDRVKHRACFSRTLSDASRVKQHLVRTHVIVFFCQRCLLTFKDLDTYNKHVMRPSSSICAPNPSASLDGISPQQQRQLSRKSKHPGLSEADKWFKIWEILFPGHTHPNSPYIDMQLTEDCAMFQEYAELSGPDLVLQALEASNVLSMTDLTEEERREVLRRAVNDGIHSIVDTWSSSRERTLFTTVTGVSASASASADDGDDSRLSAIPSVTPAGSIPDSGVLITSRASENSSAEASANDGDGGDSRLRAIPSVTPAGSVQDSGVLVDIHISENSSSHMSCPLEGLSKTRLNSTSVGEEINDREVGIVPEAVQYEPSINHQSPLNALDAISVTREFQDIASTGDRNPFAFTGYTDVNDLESFMSTEIPSSTWTDFLGP